LLSVSVACLLLAGGAARAELLVASTHPPLPVLHGKVGEKLVFTLSEADEIPRDWTNALYRLLGATKDGRPINNISQLQFTNTVGRLEWTPEPEAAGRYEFLFAVMPDRNSVMAVRRAIDIAVPAITTDTTPAGRQLTEWWRAGEAAGLVGDIYDNHDNGHSSFNTALFPQLGRMEYSEEFKQRKLNVGAQIEMLYTFTTVGNSSMAAPPESGGCLTRTLLMDRRTSELLAAQYRRNLIYIYPEHRDHDPGHNGHGDGYGDLLPANTPYGLLSQGSSGSDQPFIRAWFWTLASFRPEVKRTLTENGLLMPAMQMIFRMSNKNLRTPEDYFSGLAHPTAFEGANVDSAAMMKMAHAMRLDSLPPLVQLRVLEEDPFLEGRDFFDPGGDEELFTTPYAVARVMRASAGSSRMLVSAAGSYALNSRIESYRWVVLRGDPSQVQITPRSADGSVVEIRVAYQGRRPVAPGASLESCRIDIGAFAKTASALSPPSFISFSALDNEARTYTPDGRRVDIGYDAGDTTLAADAVKDWAALAELVCSDATSAPEAFWRSQWSGADLAALRAAAADVKTAAVAVAEARRLQALATTDDEKKKLREAAEKADKQLASVRTQRQPKLGDSFEARVLAVFNKFKDNPQFTLQNAPLLAGLPDNGLAQERRRLIARGVARQEGIQLIWTPARGSLDKLTAYEQDRIAWLNIAALRTLYPKIIGRNFRVNYVDPRLTAPQAWRDVYQYDDAGRLIGWKRFRDDKVESFTADGYLVTETDKLGRASQARRVCYLRKEVAPATIRVEMGLGPVVRYAYASDLDRIGRAIR
jgi:hypothetical protein